MKNILKFMFLCALAASIGLGLLISCDEEKTVNSNPIACLQVATFQQVEGLKLLNAGGTYKFTRDIRNDGPADAKDITLSYYLSADETITGSDVSLNVQETLNIPSGGNNVSGINLTIPASAKPGIQYYIGVLIESSSCTNNCPAYKSYDLKIADKPIVNMNCLKLSYWEIADSTHDEYYIHSGELLSFNGSIFNEGADACPDVVVRYYLSEDSKITTDDTYLNVENSFDIPLGVFDFKVKLSMPSDLADGHDYYIGILLISSGCENTCETYSIRKVKYEESPFQILAWHLDYAGPDYLVLNRSARFYRQIYNERESVSCSNIKIGYYYSQDHIITPADTLLLEETINQLLPKEKNESFFNLLIPSSITEESGYIGILVLSSDCSTKNGPSSYYHVEIRRTPCISIDLHEINSADPKGGGCAYRDFNCGQVFSIKRQLHSPEYFACNNVKIRYYLYPAANCHIGCDGLLYCSTVQWDRGIYLNVEETLGDLPPKYIDSRNMDILIPKGLAPGPYVLDAEFISSDCNLPGQEICWSYTIGIHLNILCPGNE
jgi:hypothetical protein